MHESQTLDNLQRSWQPRESWKIKLCACISHVQMKMNTVIYLTQFCRHTSRVGCFNSETVKEGFIEVTFRLTVKERFNCTGFR